MDRDLTKELLKRSYKVLAKERSLLEHILKNYEDAVKSNLINPKKIPKVALLQIVYSYRDATWMKEKEIVRKQFLRGRG